MYFEVPLSKNQADLKQEAGKGILNLLDAFVNECNSNVDCLNCLLCDDEEGPEEIDPLKCFAYFIATEFGVDLEEYYNFRKEESNTRNTRGN